jgi:hypothetical protein
LPRPFFEFARTGDLTFVEATLPIGDGLSHRHRGGLLFFARLIAEQSLNSFDPIRQERKSVQHLATKTRLG